MDFLIREVSHERGQVVYLDTEVSSASITIGSAPDQLIQLRGDTIAREHAYFKIKSRRLSIVCVKKNKVIVNGKRVKFAKLRVGDEIELQTHRIKIAQPPNGFDAACELTPDEELQDHTLESAYVTQLSDTFLGKRTPSYILSLLVILGVFAWPLSAYLTRSSDGISNQEANQVIQRIEERLGSEEYAGGGDILWLSGPLLPAHQLEIGDNCSACHKAAFQKVQDSACLDCHQSTEDHYDPNTQMHFSFGVNQCQSCHKEHNEPAMMVVDADELCIDCHEKPIVSSDKNSPDIDSVSGFKLASHPPFKLDFLLPKINKKGTGIQIEWYRQLTPVPSKQKEVSNLKFPHDVHLDEEKVQTLGKNEAMVCSDCHTLKSDNEHFEGITMERHCSQCHDLSFDISNPDRQLPHGDPRSVVQSIEEYFVRVYTDPNFKGTGKDRRRRRPGQIDSVDLCEKASFTCAIERATKEAGVQFTQRGCVNCHEVTDNGSNDLYSRWTVLPVKINHNWYARGYFDHLSHLTQIGKSENEMCSSCHEAQESTVSSDVMIPDIKNCLVCHGDQNVGEKVNVNCISCHAFHPEPDKI